jgi:hypothetical protein
MPVELMEGLVDGIRASARPFVARRNYEEDVFCLLCTTIPVDVFDDAKEPNGGASYPEPTGAGDAKPYHCGH